MGEETRHSRLFARLLEQLGPPAPNPLDNRIVDLISGQVDVYGAADRLRSWQI